MRAREPAKADFGPWLPRIHPPGQISVPAPIAWGMRARRAGNAAARPRRSSRPPRKPGGGPPRARRRWARRYRALRRAQPGLASQRQTRPKPALPETS